MKRVLIVSSNLRERNAIKEAISLQDYKITEVIYENEIDIAMTNAAVKGETPDIIILHGTLHLTGVDIEHQNKLEYNGAALYGIVRAYKRLREKGFKGVVYLMKTGNQEVDARIKRFKDIHWNTRVIPHNNFERQLHQLTWRFKRQKR